MKNFGVITRGGLFPVGGRRGRVRLTDTSGWTDSEDGWTWALLISRQRGGGTPDLSIEADEVSIAGNVLSAWFKADDSVTAALADIGIYNVDLQSTDGSGNVSIWHVVEGTVRVQDETGE